MCVCVCVCECVCVCVCVAYLFCTSSILYPNVPFSYIIDR